MCTDSQLFVGEDGHLGFAHRSVREQDVVSILHGYDVPAVLRPNGEQQYHYVTYTWYEDAMFGEAVWWNEDEADGNRASLATHY